MSNHAALPISSRSFRHVTLISLGYARYKGPRKVRAFRVRTLSARFLEPGELHYSSMQWGASSALAASAVLPNPPMFTRQPLGSGSKANSLSGSPASTQGDSGIRE